MGIIKVKKGDSTELQRITHSIEGEAVADYTGYALTYTVLDSKSKAVKLADRSVVVDVEKGFTIALNPADTNALGVGEYLMVADLSKTVGEGEDAEVVFNRELSWTLMVTPNLRDN